MFCKKCGAELDADFKCPSCGVQTENSQNAKVIVCTQNAEISDDQKGGLVCRKCGKRNPDAFVFCPECGEKLRKGHKRTYLIGGIALVLFVSLAICLVALQKNSLKSPIEGVSKKVYDQGQEYLEKMDSSDVKEAVAEYVDSNPKTKLNEVYKYIEGVDFSVETGEKATAEEIYYAQLIDKYWESKAICYAHEAIMAQFDESDITAVQMASTMYKGLVSDFEKSMDEAEEVLKKASAIDDLEEAYQILEDIWESEDDNDL